VNGALTAAFDAALGPLMGWPPVASLLVVSLVTAVVMLLVVARTSNQKGLATTKRGIHAALFEIRLFGDDPVNVLRALGEVVMCNAHYLRLSLVPLLWMAIPLVLVVAQLQGFYGYEGLTPGVPAIVKVELRQTASSADVSADALVMDAPDGIRIDTAAVRLLGSNEVLWRIVPNAEGTYALTIRDGDRAVTKSLQVSASRARRSPRRLQAGLAGQVLYPSEPLVPEESRIAAITVMYPEPGLEVLGWRAHWMIVYGLLSMACALILARRFGVTI
jgi:hypothetical protein